MYSYGYNTHDLGTYAMLRMRVLQIVARFAPMETFPTGTATPLARCISAEIRARLAAERKTQRDLAAMVGATSHNYWSIRLRDMKPFTLDDLDLICAAWDEDPGSFVKTATEKHLEWVYAELDRGRVSERSPSVPDAIAAHEDGSIAGEQESTNET
jgi:transcriptional regulator with XRE-family HTH domain